MNQVSRPNGVEILCIGPHGFAGAGEAMRRWLAALANADMEVTLISKRLPSRSDALVKNQVRVLLPDTVTTGASGETGAAGSEDALANTALAENLIALATASARRGNHPLIWAHYLFPFGLAAYLAIQRLEQDSIPCTFWLTPTGSDVWELAPKFSALAELLLTSAPDRIIVYSPRFAGEIAPFADARRISVIDPIIDCDRFRPASRKANAAVRLDLGISPEAFVICHHSNMRPVKRPADVVRLSQKVAALLRPRPCHLLLVGPQSDMIAEHHDTTSLKLHRLGLRMDVERYIAASDIELNLSVHDSFNLSLGEAMACGVPVATTDVVGIAPHILASRGGVVVPVQDTQPQETKYATLAENIAAFAETPDRLSRGATLAQYVRTHLNGDRARAALLQLMPQPLYASQ